MQHKVDKKPIKVELMGWLSKYEGRNYLWICIQCERCIENPLAESFLEKKSGMVTNSPPRVLGWALWDSAGKTNVFLVCLYFLCQMPAIFAWISTDNIAKIVVSLVCFSSSVQEPLLCPRSSRGGWTSIVNQAVLNSRELLKSCN